VLHGGGALFSFNSRENQTWSSPRPTMNFSLSCTRSANRARS
jgi:hypothetical protein